MTNIEKLDAFFGSPPDCYFLATVDGDTPKCRPLGLHHLYQNRIYFGVGDFKEVYKQLQANPKAEIVAVRNGMNWVRINGKAVFEKDDAPVVKEIYKNFMMRRHYEANGWRLKIFHMADATVQYISNMTVTETFHMD